MAEGPRLVGVVSDTHSIVRAEAIAALQGAELIIHAGDIGRKDVIDKLSRAAPVLAIKGNIDKGVWTKEYPATRHIEFAGYSFYVVHNLKWIGIDPAAAGYDCVISGHSHKPSITQKDGVLFMNPGSCGPRRFRLPVCLGRIRVTPTGLVGEIVELPARQ